MRQFRVNGLNMMWLLMNENDGGEPLSGGVGIEQRESEVGVEHVGADNEGLDVDDEVEHEVNDGGIVSEGVCLVVNAASMAALMCICGSGEEGDVIDKEKDIYLAAVEQMIPSSSIVSVTEIRK